MGRRPPGSRRSRSFGGGRGTRGDEYRVRRFMTIAASALGVVVLIGALVWFGQRRLLYLPDRSLPEPPEWVEPSSFTTDDGISHTAWVIGGGLDPVATVVVFNGNAGDRADRLPLARRLAEAGMDVVLFDYRGYGDTDGSPDQEGLLADAVAASRLASGLANRPLVYLGESLGAAVATGVSSMLPPDGLVLRSPFISIVDEARLHYGPVPAWLVRDRWPVRDWAAEVAVPSAVVIGSRDEIVPPDHSRKVARVLGARIFEVEAGHNDPDLTSGARLVDAVMAVIEQAGDADGLSGPG